MVLDFIQMHEFMPQPLVFERGEGIWVWDVRGERYLDGISGVWVVALGHGNRRVAEAIRQQLERLEFCSPILSTNARAVGARRQLGRVMPGGADHDRAPERRLRGHRDRDQARPPVLPPDRSPGQEDRHLPVPQLPRGHHGRADRDRHGQPEDALRAAHGRGPPRRTAQLPPLPVPAPVPGVQHRVRQVPGVRDPVRRTGHGRRLHGRADPALHRQRVPPPEYWPIIREICDGTAS